MTSQSLRSNYGIITFWGPRGEGTDQLAGRLVRALGLLGNIHPVLSDWYFLRQKSGERLQDIEVEEIPIGGLDRGRVAGLIAEQIHRTDGDAVPQNGYFFVVANKPERGPRMVSLMFRCAATFFADFPSNSVRLSTDDSALQDADIFSPETFRRAVLAIAAAWEPSWCEVGSNETRDLSPSIQETGTPKVRLAWMTYLTPRFARLVTPPKSAIVDRTPEGGLLMIATADRFNVANPQHMKVAREIEAALAPVNALPWSERGA